MKKYVYKITNKINGMMYIGETMDFKRRIKEHCNPSNTSLIGENHKFENIEYPIRK